MKEEIENFFKVFKRGFTGKEISPSILNLEGPFYDDYEKDEEEKIEFDFENLKLENIKKFKKNGDGVDLAAIDVSTKELGVTEEGIVIAIRASIIKRVNSKFYLYVFGPQILSINTKNKDDMYAFIRKSLGFKDKDKTPDLIVLQDRIRNYIERLAQKEAVKCIKKGIILFDGTLIGETFDTPKTYVQYILDLAKKNKNSIIAISKKTRLISKKGTPIVNLLSNKIEPCYLDINNLIEDSYKGRSLGNIFVCKFSIEGYSFRVDVSPYKTYTYTSLLDNFYYNSSFKIGYPEVLRYAHIYSYFTAKEVLELQCLAAIKYKLKFKKTYDARPILFGPFSSGRY